MRKTITLILTIILIASIIVFGVLYWKYFRGAAPAIKQPKQDISEVINTTDMPLTLPSGFSIEIFAKDLPGARVMLIDELGNMWVSQTKEGTVSLLTIEDGQVIDSQVIFKDLKNPHGLAIHPYYHSNLYIAEEDKISRVKIYPEGEGELEKILDLPAGGRHVTRTIWFNFDKQLLISVGSSCDTCVEDDWRRSSILIANDDGTNLKTYATGLRNSVFMAMHPTSLQVWATEMGRDFLGDDLPPEEINIIKRNKDYGWPYCYGEQIHDEKFDPKEEFKSFCKKTEPAYITFQAHSAPLGLAFIPQSWPKDYAGDLLVAYHGSWNRTEPTGYKIVHFDLDSANSESDFISGWLQDNNALGRPAGLIFDNQGNLYISDDKAGVIYKVSVVK